MQTIKENTKQLCKIQLTTRDYRTIYNNVIFVQ